jgi:hypothetical protein
LVAAALGQLTGLERINDFKMLGVIVDGGRVTTGGIVGGTSGRGALLAAFLPSIVSGGDGVRIVAACRGSSGKLV